MLSTTSIERAWTGFGVFDHEPAFYSLARGEPYLINDFLAYFDGVYLCICAFRIGNPWEEASAADIEQVLTSEPSFASAEAVCLWGRHVIVESVQLPDGRYLDRTAFKDYDNSFVDAVVDLEDFDYSCQEKARLARNALRRGPLRCEVLRRNSFGAEHFALIQDWANTHDISPRSAGVIAGLPGLVAKDHIYLVECRLASCLVGFGVVARGGDVAVYLQGFARRLVGHRVGDAIYAAMVEFAKETEAQRLHLGYSPSDGLIAFKRKWGAELSGPPFRDSLFTNSAVLAGLFSSGKFRWYERLSLGEHIPVTWRNASDDVV